MSGWLDDKTLRTGEHEATVTRKHNLELLECSGIVFDLKTIDEGLAKNAFWRACERNSDGWYLSVYGGKRQERLDAVVDIFVYTV